MKIKVRAYLKYRSLIGDDISIELSEDRVTLKDALGELSQRYGEKFDDLVFEQQNSGLKRSAMVLINRQSCMNLKDGLNAELKEGDEIQLLPVLAGG